MDMEGVSSLAVVDNSHNVVGNISTVDVKVGNGRANRSYSTSTDKTASCSRKPRRHRYSTTAASTSFLSFSLTEE
jgi:hypothetical protein